MFRALLRLVLVMIVLVGAAAFFLGWWGSSRVHPTASPAPATVGTGGRVDTDKAKAVGAEVGAKTAEAANRAGEILSEGALTAKIKSKMALDDRVKANAIHVETSGPVVTLTGTVASVDERQRAVRLARETDGITQVIDKLRVTQ